ncbi:nucleotidyl transferase AbiEii/AbiGii toxin family protein [Amycolatopsis suaedae]|uniref:Nucleotidyl transferase AbiEii/AbiGii toxin family protein n=1 Tax=Amycolatopsis suaedae TaxID=2510978 RepID=A0A4Q7J9C7_9PSEU|nr:nucleotidyl transferase AbiEii/AbiGii toxin family protein [Amycolatopsis suaedae]RZQ64361.1 hypothetical protein EWH70_10355 [Amycolatopsis suaedae]
MTLPYGSPAAFRRALTDRLRRMARPHGTWTLPDLQRQFAYDRLVARLYAVDDRWIIKGATALLAREIAVRHTIDIDVYRAVNRDQAERDLRAAAEQDLGDWFRFETGQAIRVADVAQGVRVPVVAVLGATPWTRFHVDVVCEGIRMTGVPDDVTSLVPVMIPGLEQPAYRVYPLVDHIADKLAAIFELYGEQRRPSARFKDLVDLVAVVGQASVDGRAQREALRSEAVRRGLSLPARFDVPDRALWKPGYEAEARRAAGLSARTLDDALRLVVPFVDPLLDGTAAGRWNPATGAWEA